MKITCPSCKKESDYYFVADVPDQQVMYMSIKYEGRFISAKTLAGFIGNTEKLLKSVAKDIGTKVEVFVESIEYETNQITIGFQILRVKGK